MNRNDAGRAIKRCDYVSSSEVLVFLALLEAANNADCGLPDWCRPTIPEIVSWTKLSRSTVVRSISHLGLHHWLDRDVGRGRGKRSSYRLVTGSPDSTCTCERVAPVHPSNRPIGLTVTPIEAVKGVTVEQKRSHSDTTKVSRATESSQVGPAFVRREAGTGEGISSTYKRCDRCDSTDIQMFGAYRLCREHAGSQWRETA